MSKDIKKMKEENKSRKQLAHKNLMIQCGGGEKEGNILPYEYVPECFANGEMCDICKTVFNINHELRMHAQSVHEDYVKKCWSKNALLNILHYEEYKTWLEQPYDMEINEFNVEKASLDKDSSELRVRNKNLIYSQEAYLKVSQIGNIIETSFQFIGTISISVFLPVEFYCVHILASFLR